MKFIIELNEKQVQYLVCFLQAYETSTARQAASLHGQHSLLAHAKQNMLNAHNLRHDIAKQYQQQIK